MMKRLVSGALLVLLAAGQSVCAAAARPVTALQRAIQAEEKVVARKLKYPDTARYRDLRAYPIKGGHLVVVCGAVGGKSEFGGYSVYLPFIAAVQDGVADPDQVVLDDPTLPTEYTVAKRCQLAAKGKAPFFQAEP